MYDKKNYFSTNKSETQIENNNLQSFYESILKQKRHDKNLLNQKKQNTARKEGRDKFAVYNERASCGTINLIRSNDIYFFLISPVYKFFFFFFLITRLLIRLQLIFHKINIPIFTIT